MNTTNHLLKLILSLILAGVFLSACGKSESDKPDQNESKMCDPADYCKNGGKCTVNAQGAKECDCTGTSFTGDTCSEPKEAAETCEDTYCKNGGTCSIVDGKRSCDCSHTNYKGETCETQKTCQDDNPCQNNGQCSVDGTTGALTCDCSGTNFKGETCETKKTCAEDSPCQNGGTCSEDAASGDLLCVCPAEWRGTNCEEKTKPFIFEIKVEDPKPYDVGTNPNYTYSYKIDCHVKGEQPNYGETLTGNTKCAYDKAGTYTVYILGEFPHLDSDSHVYGNRNWEPINQRIKKVVDWGTNTWKSMEGMFQYNKVLESLSETTPDFSQLTSTGSMFYASNYSGPIPDVWDTSNVTDMSSMFSGADSFNQSLSHLKTTNVTDMSSMFSRAALFNKDISHWDISKVTNMSHMFYRASEFEYSLLNWEVLDETNLTGMFNGTKVKRDSNAFKEENGVYIIDTPIKLQNILLDDVIPLNKIKLSDSLKSISGAFSNTRRTDFDGIESWDTSNITNMSGVFAYLLAFHEGISGWDTSKVTDMSYMFMNSRGFNEELTGWDTSEVTNMRSMFSGAGWFNKDISGWDTSKVTDMSGMFFDAVEFNKSLQTNGNQWNTSSVTDMSYMFDGAAEFDGDISGWDTSSVTDMKSMFDGAHKFDRNISGWDTSKVTNMSRMFYDAISFDQNLSEWKVGSIQSCFRFSGNNPKTWTKDKHPNFTTCKQ